MAGIGRGRRVGTTLVRIVAGSTADGAGARAGLHGQRLARVAGGGAVGVGRGWRRVAAGAGGHEHPRAGPAAVAVGLEVGRRARPLRQRRTARDEAGRLLGLGVVAAAEVAALARDTDGDQALGRQHVVALRGLRQRRRCQVDDVDLGAAADDRPGRAGPGQPQLERVGVVAPRAARGPRRGRRLVRVERELTALVEFAAEPRVEVRLRQPAAGARPVAERQPHLVTGGPRRIGRAGRQLAPDVLLQVAPADGAGQHEAAVDRAAAQPHDQVVADALEPDLAAGVGAGLADRRQHGGRAGQLVHRGVRAASPRRELVGVALPARGRADVVGGAHVALGRDAEARAEVGRRRGHSRGGLVAAAGGEREPDQDDQGGPSLAGRPHR